MGQGQADLALSTLREATKNGNWVTLKNLHLATSWLPVLEKELLTLAQSGGVHENFRLWLTTEPHLKFSPILLQSSLKITYEAPPGIKKNLTVSLQTHHFVLYYNLIISYYFRGHTIHGEQTS